MYHVRAVFSDVKQAPLIEKILLFFSCAAVVVTIGVLLSYASLTNSRAVVTVSFLDVGQGDATYIEAPGGTDVLIDGGQTQAVVRERAKLEPFWDRSIDIIIATHPDADHIGGLVDVLERLHVELVGVSGFENDTNVSRAFDQAVEDEGVDAEKFARGTRITLDGSVVLTVLAPTGESSDANESSIVIRLDYGETSFLFTGDAPASVETALAANHSEVDTDVLKVGHHGSDTSTAAQFVRAVSPASAVISVGGDNRYGHPTENVLQTLEENDVEVVRTDEDGTIVYTSNGTEIKRSRASLLDVLF